MTPKPNSPLDLIPLIGTPQFNEALSWYEVVTPKPWKHELVESPFFDVVTKQECYYCHKCGKIFKNCTKFKASKDVCPIPDTFTGSLGDLAFELMKKVSKWDFDIACKKIYELLRNDVVLWPYKPEYAICASLLALEMAEKESGK